MNKPWTTKKIPALFFGKVQLHFYLVANISLTDIRVFSEAAKDFLILLSWFSSCCTIVVKGRLEAKICKEEFWNIKLSSLLEISKPKRNPSLSLVYWISKMMWVELKKFSIQNLLSVPSCNKKAPLWILNSQFESQMSTKK